MSVAAVEAVDGSGGEAVPSGHRMIAEFLDSYGVEPQPGFARGPFIATYGEHQIITHRDTEGHIISAAIAHSSTWGNINRVEAMPPTSDFLLGAEVSPVQEGLVLVRSEGDYRGLTLSDGHLGLSFFQGEDLTIEIQPSSLSFS